MHTSAQQSEQVRVPRAGDSSPGARGPGQAASEAPDELQRGWSLDYVGVGDCTVWGQRLPHPGGSGGKQNVEAGEVMSKEL